MITGWVDLSAQFSSVSLDNARVAAAPHTGEKRIALEGAEIRACGTGTDLAIERGLLVVCEGAPRFRHEGAKRAAMAHGLAAGWIALLGEKREEGLPLVAGSFAVAFVDLRNRSALLACDRFAIRGLCYALERGRLAFADRADSIPGGRGVDIDLQAIYDYLYFHVIPAPRTIFRGVSRLPAACFAAFDETAARVDRHWSPSFRDDPPGSLEDLRHEFRSLLREAVARESDGLRVGSFLSGGTDSSTVSGMLGEVAGHPAVTYSIGFEAEGYDEMAYARIASQHFGTEHHEYYLTPDDLVRSIPEVAQHYDQPFGNSSALPAYYCARLAKGDGVEKLLAGDGGDELFGGNTRYALQRVFDAYHQLPSGLRSTVIEPLLLNAAWPAAVPIVRKAVGYVRQARLPMPDRMNTYNLLERLGVEHVLEIGFLREVDVHEPVRQQREAYSRVDGHLVNAMLAYDWKYALADNDLPKVCGTAALAGLAVGFPLLADEIVDFSLRLPHSLKLRGLRLRYFFKEALRGYLPEATITKKKHGFGLPFGPWLIRHAGLRDLSRTFLASLADRGIVRRPFLDGLVDQTVSEHPGYFGEMVWILMILEGWLANHSPRFRLERPR